MAYEPENPEELRKAFKEIRDTRKFSAQKMIDLAFGFPAPRRPSPTITVTTLNRFINGGGGYTKELELCEIARALANHPTFRRHFQIAQGAPAPTAPVFPADPFDSLERFHPDSPYPACLR